MKKKEVLILGALSDIAKSTAQKFGENGYNLSLAARDLGGLKKLSIDLKVRNNIEVDIYEFDILKNDTHKDFIKNLKKIPSILICAVGLLGEQKENEEKIEFRTKVLRTNYEGPVNIISYFANIYVRIITSMPVKDSTSGFVGYSNEALSSLNINKIKFNGYAFQIEMKFKLWKKKFKLKEHQIIFVNREHGKSKMNKNIIFEAIIGVIKLKLNSIFKKR